MTKEAAELLVMEGYLLKFNTADQPENYYEIMKYFHDTVTPFHSPLREDLFKVYSASNTTKIPKSS